MGEAKNIWIYHWLNRHWTCSFTSIM